MLRLIVLQLIVLRLILTLFVLILILFVLILILFVLILILFVLKANFPAGEQFPPRLDITEIWVIAGTLQFTFTVYNIFEGVIGDNAMNSPLVFHGNRLLY